MRLTQSLLVGALALACLPAAAQTSAEVKRETVGNRTTENVPATGEVAVTLHLTAGDVNITMDREKAPCTVNSFVSLTEQGYFAFAEQALSERRSTGLPPFSHLALLRAEAHKPGQAEEFLDHACSEAELLLEELSLHGVELLGPIPAPMERRAGRYRAQLLLQANARAPLHRLLAALLAALERMPSGRAVRWSLDVDPIDLF